MFNKSNKDTSTPDALQQNSAPPKRTAMKSKAPSILSGDLVLTGSIASEGEVQLDGTVEGDIRAGSLIIGEEAVVNGEVIAETVVIRGRVNGSVNARQVQLASTARIEGDIVHAALSVESGAFFDGHCRHSSDPLSEKSGAPKSVGKSEPSAPPAPSKSSVTSMEPPVAANKSSA
jgi:cytoskeletal protein CcmA (bactofilin family)